VGGGGGGGGGRLRGSRKAQSQKLGTHRSQNIYFHTLPHVTHPKIKLIILASRSHPAGSKKIFMRGDIRVVR